ncbi:MAG: methyltransferase domain-containing protein [Patescibacteria group bacterium]
MAQAFADQREALPYKEMLRDIMNALTIETGSDWIDLGCGSGRISQALWEKASGDITITAMDCSEEAGKIYLDYAREFNPVPQNGAIRFRLGNVSHRLPFMGGKFHGVVASLVLTYAEDWDITTGMWTRWAFDNALREVHRILVDGGQLVLTNNTPNPDFLRIFLRSWRQLVSRKGPRLIRNSATMLSFGRWLKRSAVEGRFHYLPESELVQSLRDAGFRDIQCQLTYADQAYLVRCRK